MPSIISKLFPKEKDDSIFKIERLSHSNKNGECLTNSGSGGGLITTDKIKAGSFVVTVKDDKGKVQILGQDLK